MLHSAPPIRPSLQLWVSPDDVTSRSPDVRPPENSAKCCPRGGEGPHGLRGQQVSSSISQRRYGNEPSRAPCVDGSERGWAQDAMERRRR